MLVGLSWSSSASAYCRTMSCEFGEDAREEKCERDPVTNCVTEGEPTHWSSACLDYAVQLDGSPRSGLDADQVQALVAQAFAEWKNAPCPGGGTPNFEVHFQGFVTCDRRQTVCGPAAENVNTILFRDQDWPADTMSVAGLTVPIGSTKSGFVIDADVAFNSTYFNFDPTVADPTRQSVELIRVMTHELGHFLGLAHSDVSGALMSVFYNELPMGASILSDDDVQAICAIYPPSASAAVCESTSPAYDTCSVDEISATNPCALPAETTEDAAAGCSLTDTSPRGGSRFGWIAAFGVAVVALRRRHAARRVVV